MGFWGFGANELKNNVVEISKEICHKEMLKALVEEIANPLINKIIVRGSSVISSSYGEPEELKSAVITSVGNDIMVKYLKRAIANYCLDADPSEEITQSFIDVIACQEINSTLISSLSILMISSQILDSLMPELVKRQAVTLAFSLFLTDARFSLPHSLTLTCSSSLTFFVSH